MEKETKIVSLVVVTSLAVFGVLMPFIRTNENGFSEIAVFGQNGTLGDYPANLHVNSPFDLYGYIENHQGFTEYYEFLVKLGNKSTSISNTTYAKAPVLFQILHVIGNNQNYSFPIFLAIGEPGLDQRLIFELWMFNTNDKEFVYTGVWAAIWLNVTF
jgi:uncharacterized membrane protein